MDPQVNKLENFTKDDALDIFSGNKMSGSCGNSKENPCDCSLAERIKCSFKKE